MRKPRGVILFEGRSRIDGQPIVVIATFKSKNEKTGDMIQTYIIRSDVNPIDALKTGDDVSICGDCPLRRIACYVDVPKSVNAVFKAYKRGAYPQYDKTIHGQYFIGRQLRLGAYGDPVAAPMPAWRSVLSLVDGHTGYSHQWKQAKFRHWSKYIMASTHSEMENHLAREMGWRSFRTRRENQAVASDEIVCPASPEGNNRHQCKDCLACDGGSNRKRSIVIIGHGGKAKMSGFNSFMDEIEEQS